MRDIGLSWQAHILDPGSAITTTWKRFSSALAMPVVLELEEQDSSFVPAIYLAMVSDVYREASAQIGAVCSTWSYRK